MPSRIIIHHSCCAEAPFEYPEEHCRGESGEGYLVHADGSITSYAHQPPLSEAADRVINVVLIGYFNSGSRTGCVDHRQLSSLTELLRLFFYSGEELLRQPLCHHRFCPGYRFPWEELEWRLWNMLA